MGAGGGGGFFWAAMPQLTQLLLLLMVLDTALGVARAIRAHDLSAHAAWEGNEEAGDAASGGCCGGPESVCTELSWINLVQAASAFTSSQVDEHYAQCGGAGCAGVCADAGVMRYFRAVSGQQPDAGDEEGDEKPDS